MSTQNINQIKFGWSKKIDGDMILNKQTAGENRQRYFAKKNININKTISASLMHSDHVQIVTASDAGKIIPDTDALVTADKDLCLTVTFSDCLPIFIYDELRQIIGIAHAGWRGVLAGIASAVVNVMVKELNSSMHDIKIYIGPHIKSCHFEIQNDILDQFSEYPSNIINKDDKIFIDLAAIVQAQLLEQGYKANNIIVSPECTYCDLDYFSFRREQPVKPIVQVAYIF